MLPPLASPTAHWIPSRDEALRRVVDFLPRAGRAYAAQRNYDRGPSDRTNVSTLSPYLRYRAITEAELLAAVLERHSPTAAEKFIAEIFWRTYWKGWLQAHPVAWSRYQSTLAERLVCADVAAAAVTGQTGIDAFDAWARELVETNYLHNHARMWFASIWIFTLKLPWELGADFFMRHLLDGDPASNTLSWRWVAGLQTRGKTYTAGRDNIRRYTGERFALDSALARSTPALTDEPIPLAAGPAPATAPLAAEPTLLVIHDDDLLGDFAGAEQFVPGVRAVCGIRSTAGRSPQPLSEAVIAFAEALGRDAVTRLAARADVVDLGLIEAGADVLRLAAGCGATRVIAPFAPVGPARDVLDRLRDVLAAGGIAYAERGRRYDAVSWPAARSGFFGLRSRIPAILSELVIGSGAG